MCGGRVSGARLLIVAANNYPMGFQAKHYHGFLVAIVHATLSIKSSQRRIEWCYDERDF